MKHALVTGGSRGIGRAICLKLADMGYRVIINYHSNDMEAEKTLALIHQKDGAGELLKFDIGDPAQVTTILGGWIEKNQEPPLEVLVNNAGIRKDTLMMWMKTEEWQDVMHTNLNSFFFITRLVLKDMLVRKYGRIVNVVSLSGQAGHPGQVNDSAAKAAVIGATKALAQEVGRRKVTVNAVAPGWIKTEMTADLPEKELKRQIPLNRFGEASEVAEVVGFLASEKSSYITGAVIPVNGGLYT
ncbi:MAG: 3-oxoacyl-ACP reductase FabG [bacterium]